MPQAASLKPLKRTELPRSKEALVLVDVINPMDFPGAHKLLAQADAAAHRIARLKTRLTRRGVAAIYANDNYGTWHSEFRDILAACQQMRGRRGEIARMLTPTPEDLVVLKPRHSAFHSTPLDHLLEQMGVEKLTIVGWAADMCVMLTATDARMNGYEVWVPSDCTAAESARRHGDALRQLRTAFKCTTRPAARN